MSLKSSVSWLPAEGLGIFPKVPHFIPLPECEPHSADQFPYHYRAWKGNFLCRATAWSHSVSLFPLREPRWLFLWHSSTCPNFHFYFDLLSLLAAKVSHPSFLKPSSVHLSSAPYQASKCTIHLRILLWQEKELNNTVVVGGKWLKWKWNICST